MTERNPEDYCPDCNSLYIIRCKCPRGDRSCDNGHSWHYCLVHNKLVIGLSNHSLSTFSCTCKPNIIEK